LPEDKWPTNRKQLQMRMSDCLSLKVKFETVGFYTYVQSNWGLN